MESGCFYEINMIKYNDKYYVEESLMEEKKNLSKKAESFKNYLKISMTFGIGYGLMFGWMWGWKGIIIAPLIGITVGFILALIFTFSRLNLWKKTRRQLEKEAQMKERGEISED